MSVSDETLIAYADGELSGEDRRAVEAGLASDPALREKLERQLALRRQIDAAFAPSLDAAVPDRLLRAVMETPVSPSWRMADIFARARRLFSDRRFLLWTGMPAGAALACGIALGMLLSPGSAFRMEDGAMFASGRVANALDRQLAQLQAADAPVKVGLSFRAKDGRYCRTFETAGAADALAGVACRDSRGWAVATLQAAPRETAGAYQMAGSTMPDAVRNAVDDMIVGEPLDAAGEKAARDKGWR